MVCIDQFQVSQNSVAVRPIYWPLLYRRGQYIGQSRSNKDLCLTEPNFSYPPAFVLGIRARLSWILRYLISILELTVGKPILLLSRILRNSELQTITLSFWSSQCHFAFVNEVKMAKKHVLLPLETTRYFSLVKKFILCTQQRN